MTDPTPAAAYQPGTRPTGRRKITEAELSARARLSGTFGDVNKFAATDAFQRAAPAMGYSPSLVHLVSYLLGETWTRDWGAKQLLVWPSNEMISHRISREISQVKVLIRAAIDAGLIVPVDQGSGKRAGRRDPVTRAIQWAYGFDLSPVAERIEEFRRAAADYDARLTEARALRKEVSHLRVMILGLADMGMLRGDDAVDWAALVESACAQAACARGSRNPVRLAKIAASMRLLLAKVEHALAVGRAVESNPSGPENRPLYTTTKTVYNAYACTKHVASPAPEGRSGSTSVPASRDQGVGTSAQGAFRGFPASPRIVVQIAPQFQALVVKPQPTWNDVLEAAFVVRGTLGISQHAYGQACLVLGRHEAAATLAAISARFDRGEVSSPGGLLRAMVAAHTKGTLYLDRTLFGLLDRSGGSGPSRPTRGSTRSTSQMPNLLNPT